MVVGVVDAPPAGFGDGLLVFLLDGQPWLDVVEE